MPSRQKQVLLAIFFTPLVAIVFAILRLVFQEELRVGPTINLVQLIVHSTLEVSICKYHCRNFEERIELDFAALC